MLAVVLLGFLNLIMMYVPCAAQTSAKQGFVTGTLTYRQRISLPPDASVDISLEDVTQSSTEPKLIGETVFSAAGRQVPLPFQVSFSLADIDSAHRYQLNASIRTAGKLMFTSDTPYPVITTGAKSHLVIVVQQVDAQYLREGSATKLQGTHWKLTQLNGRPAVAEASSKEPSLVIHKRTDEIVATSGCNAVLGSYVLSGDSLQLSPEKHTMKTCSSNLMEQEKAFVTALKTTSTYRINENTLELINGNQVLATFLAEH